jgi:hypothetical protein
MNACVADFAQLSRFWRGEKYWEAEEKKEPSA